MNTDSERARKVPLFALFCLSAILLPALLLLIILLPYVQALPHEDYWQILPKLFDSLGQLVPPSHWLVNTNEHPIVLPALLYAVNVKLFSGSNNTLVLLSWFIALAGLLVLARLLPDRIRRSKSSIVVLLAASALIFSPAAASVWIMGFAGIHFGLVNLFAFLALGFFSRAYYKPSWSLLSAALVSGWLGSLTNTPGLFVWFLTSLVVLCSPKLPRRFLLFPLCFALVLPYNLQLLTAPRATQYPMAGFDLLQKCSAILATVGSPFSGKPFSAAVAGCSGLAITGFLLVLMARKEKDSDFRRDVFVWILVGAYGLLGCLSAGLMRGGTEIGAVVIERYRFLALPFWIALLVLSLRYILGRGRTAWTPTLAWHLGAAALVLRTWSFGIPLLGVYLERENSARFAAISLQLDIPDRGWIRNTLSQSPGDLVGLLPALRMLNHIPFSSSAAPCPEWDSRINLPVAAAEIGSFDVIDEYTPNAFRTTGTISTSGGPIEGVLITNSEGMLRGCAVAGYPRANFFEPSHTKNTGWRGYARRADPQEILSAFAILPRRSELQFVGSFQPQTQERSREPAPLRGSLGEE